MENIDALLVGGEPEASPGRKAANFGLDELHISKYAFEKAFRYAKLIMQGRYGSMEVGGFLTKPKDADDRVARDAFLARDQEVSRTLYKVNAEDVVKAGKEIEERGQKIIGWWHSHGRLSTFHSGTDAANQMTLLNQISPSNYITYQHERAYGRMQSRLEGKTLVFWDPENPATEFRLDLKNESPELTAEKLRILEEKRIGFAYSLVVNWPRWVRNRKPYCEIATREPCRFCAEPRDTSMPVGCTIFDEGEYKIDDKELLEEIKERVYVAGERVRGAKKEYFLPAVFEKKKADGTLTKPDFGPEIKPIESQGIISIGTEIVKDILGIGENKDLFTGLPKDEGKGGKK